MSVDKQLNALLIALGDNPHLETLTKALGQIAAALREAEDSIDRVETLHAPTARSDGFYVCAVCKVVPDHYGNVYPALWPCPTIDAIRETDAWANVSLNQKTSSTSGKGDGE